MRNRWVVLGGFILILAIGVSGLRYFKVSASWEDYFLEDDPMLVKTEEFKEIFGNDNFAAVLTRCDNSFTKDNLELIRELTNEIVDSLSYADKITSLTDIEFMMGGEDGIAIEQIVPDTIPTDPKQDVYKRQVITVDKSAVEYYRKLSELTAQIHKIGVLYNQAVRAINSYHSVKTAQILLEKLEQLSVQIIALQEQAISLTIDYRK